MGVFALFCTQSNDVAIGLPIVTALYPLSQYPANYPGWVLVLTSLQTLIVTPICIAIMESGKTQWQSDTDDDEKARPHAGACGESATSRRRPAPGHPRAKTSVLWTVLKGTLSAPLVVGVFLGLAVNLIFGREALADGLLHDLLSTMGNSFTFCALFATGMSIAEPGPKEHSGAHGDPETAKTEGHPLSRQRSASYVQTSAKVKDRTALAVLVVFKGLLLAILIRFTLTLLVEDNAEMSSFGFLYGVLPTAALPVVLAKEYRVMPGVIAKASVVSIVVAMPLMIITPIIFAAMECAQIMAITSTLSLTMTILGILAVLLMAYVYHTGPNAIASLQPVALALTTNTVQGLYSGSHLLCALTTGGNPGWDWFITQVVAVFREASRWWVAALVIHLLWMARGRYTDSAPIPLRNIHMATWSLTAITYAATLIAGASSSNDLAEYGLSCWIEARSQAWIGVVSEMIMICLLLGCLQLVTQADRGPRRSDYVDMGSIVGEQLRRRPPGELLQVQRVFGAAMRKARP